MIMQRVAMQLPEEIRGVDGESVTEGAPQHG